MTHTTASPKSGTAGPIIVLLGLGLAAWATVSRVPAAPVDAVIQRGREAVLLHYVKHANWGPIRCREAQYEGRDMLYCHPSGNTRRGGLHVIRREGGEPVVLPVNGTAKGQMRQFTTIEAVDTSRVSVREWDGPSFDIRKAIEATL